MVHFLHNKLTAKNVHIIYNEEVDLSHVSIHDFFMFCHEYNHNLNVVALMHGQNCTLFFIVDQVFQKVIPLHKYMYTHAP